MSHVYKHIFVKSFDGLYTLISSCPKRPHRFGCDISAAWHAKCGTKISNSYSQWIGLRENLNRKPQRFSHQIWGLPVKFPQTNQLTIYTIRVVPIKFWEDWGLFRWVYHGLPREKMHKRNIAKWNWMEFALVGNILYEKHWIKQYSWPNSPFPPLSLKLVVTLP